MTAESSRQPPPDSGGANPLLLTLLDRLDLAQLPYAVTAGNSAIRVAVRPPGWRWDVTFTSDGTVEIRRFRQVGDVEHDPARLDELFHPPA